MQAEHNNPDSGTEDAPNVESALTMAQMRTPTRDVTGRATATVQHRREQGMTSQAAIGTTCVKQLHFLFTLLVTFLVATRISCPKQL